MIQPRAQAKADNEEAAIRTAGVGELIRLVLAKIIIILDTPYQGQFLQMHTAHAQRLLGYSERNTRTL